jgi:DNA-binding NarL/FixJ family response regulator
MRVLLVGQPADRAKLRQDLDGSMEVVGEFASIAEARTAATSEDAVLLLAGHRARSDGSPDEEPLTDREIEVLELVAEGLPNKSIARRLGISDQTVKFHIASILGKLRAANRTDAVRRAVRRGLLVL